MGDELVPFGTLLCSGMVGALACGKREIAWAELAGSFLLPPKGWRAVVDDKDGRVRFFCQRHPEG